MTTSKPGTRCTLRNILHPSDNSEESRRAFAYALKVSLIGRAHLALMHAETDPGRMDDWWKPPAVRSVLQDWGLLERNVPREAVFNDLGIAVTRTWTPAKNPIDGITHYLDHVSADLVVLATRGQDGLPRWLKPSVAERVSRHTNAATLFVPNLARHFVNLRNGNVSLRRVIIPIDNNPGPQRAIDLTIALMSALRVIPRSLKMIFVGKRDNRPEVDVTQKPNWPWELDYPRGAVVDAILRTAEEDDADLIVMATAGHQGFLDAMRGSTTQQVVRRAPCPVLAVPTPV